MTADKKLKVELGQRSYPILVDEGLLGRSSLLEPYLPGNQAVLVTDSRVGPIYQAKVQSLLSGRSVTNFVFPAGEASKTLETANRLITAMLSVPCNRQATVVALGGGVVGDLAGFVAACYQRGVPYIQIPTTLLSQVDSSVGGKTAVNHPLGKNMIGMFHQPACVIADTATLKTLEPREIRAGLAEVIKYGATLDAEFFYWLEQHIDGLLDLEPDCLRKAILRCCRLKALLVAKDEKESGLRALLNFGHTFGHAIERTLGYGQWLHGEAVAAGMVIASELSHNLGLLDAGARDRIFSLVDRVGLPVRLPPAVETGPLVDAMKLDKKAVDQHLRLILLKGMGEGFVADDVQQADIIGVLKRFY